MAAQWTQTPKSSVIVALAACLLIAAIGYQDAKGLGNAFVAAGVSATVDAVCGRIVKRKRNVPDGAVITGLIISSILGTTTSWIIVAATCIIAILSKYVLVLMKKPVFNPAALGLLLSIPLFQTAQSWWGAFGDLPAWTLVFILIGGYLVTNRVNKFPQVFSFLGATFILLFIMGRLHIGDASDALRPPFINATLFFALFMLTDPPTSPAKQKDQIVFGILTAVVGAIIYGLFGGLMYLFIGLLAGNLYHLLRTRSLRQKRKADPQRAGAM